MAFSVSFAFKAVDQYTKVMKNIAKATQGQAKAIDKLNKALKANRDSVNSSGKSLTTLSGKFSKSTGNIDRYTKAIRGATAATKGQEKALQQLSKAGVVMGQPGRGGGGASSRNMYNNLTAGTAARNLSNSWHNQRNGIGAHGYGAMSSSQAAQWQAQLRGYAKGKGMAQKMNYATFNKMTAAQAANNISGMNSSSGLNAAQSRAWSAQLARYKNGVMPGKVAKAKKAPPFFGKYGSSRDLDMAGFAFAEVGAAIIAPFALGAKAVVEFDTDFAQVSKILAGSSSPAEIARIRNDALELAKVYPMALEGITGIMASAASGGIAAKDLKKFSSVAIEASGAFDMSAENTVNAMLGAKAGGKMDSKTLFHYMNSVNMLDNLSNARGRDILTQTGNVMGSANNVHMKGTDAAAWITTLIQNHIGTPDAQDTTFTNMMKLGSPSTMSKPAKEALIALYTNNKGIKTGKEGRNILNKIRDGMAKDPNATLLDFLDRIHKQKHPQDFIGKMMRNGLPMQGVMALSQSIPDVKKNMKIANGQVDGSLTREYLNKMHTYAALWTLINNRLRTFSVIVGDALNKNDRLKTILFALAGSLNEVLTAIEDLVKNHPNWTTAIVLTITSIGGLILILAGLSFAVAGVNKIFMATTMIMELVTAATAFFGTQMTIAELAIAATTGACTLFEAAMVLLTGPIGWVTAAMVALYAVCPPFRNFCNDFADNAGAHFKLWFLQARIAADDLTAALNRVKVAGQGLGDMVNPLNWRAGTFDGKQMSFGQVGNWIAGGMNSDTADIGSQYNALAAWDKYKTANPGMMSRSTFMAGSGMNLSKGSDPAMMKALSTFSNPIKIDISIDSNGTPATASSPNKNARVGVKNTGKQMKTGSGGW